VFQKLTYVLTTISNLCNYYILIIF